MGILFLVSLFIGEHSFGLEHRTNQDQPLDFKNKSQQFIC